MLKGFLQAKLHPVTITEKNLKYEGSLALSSKLMKAADLEPGQLVLCVNLSNGERFETYLIEDSDGVCGLNGGTARLGEIGDELIVMAFCMLESGEKIEPKMIKIDSGNQPINST